MLNVLHRTTLDPAVLDRVAPEVERRPPPPKPPIEREPTSRWPFSARALVAVLAVLALAGAVGTVVGFSRSGDATATELQATVDDLSAERDLLRADRDEAASEVAELEATVAGLTRSREVISNELATATTAMAELEVTVADLTRSREVISNELAATRAELAEVEADLAAQIELTEAAVTERDALAALFPLTVESTLTGVELAGDYDVAATAIYCDGFANCSALPQFDELTIVETSQGWLRIEIDGYYDAGLFAVEGSLYAVAGSLTAAPGCHGVPRQATVSMTLYASGLTVADDGSHVIDDLAATLMIDAPSTGTCERGLAFSGLELTPA